jgi:hypothetical protein
MNTSKLKSTIKSYVYEILSETDIDESTIVGPKTDLNKATEIAKNEKTDPITVKTAINQAKKTNMPVTVAESKKHK